MGQITVKQLLEFCQQQVDIGNGDKKIVVADDNEGNGYHGLFYEFTEDATPYADEIYDSNDEDKPENLIILG